MNIVNPQESNLMISTQSTRETQSSFALSYDSSKQLLTENFLNTYSGFFSLLTSICLLLLIDRYAKYLIFIKIRPQKCPFHLAISLILAIHIAISNQVTCPSRAAFPKIFGSSLGNTFVFSMDVHELMQQLVVSGQTYYLVPINSQSISPSSIIAVFDIRNTDHLWVKTENTPGYIITQVRYSKQGTYIIALQQAQNNQNTGRILIFKSVDGNLFYQKIFNKITQLQRKDEINLLHIHSQGTRLHVFYQILIDDSSSNICWRTVLINLDIVSRSSNKPLWAIQQSNIRCNYPYGIAQGRTNDLFYSFQGNGDYAQITLFQDNAAGTTQLPKVMWAYKINNLRSSTDDNNMMRYQSLNQFEDAIAFIGRENYLGATLFGIIVSSSTSPSKILKTKALLDPKIYLEEIKFSGLYFNDNNVLYTIRINLAFDVGLLVTVNLKTKTSNSLKIFPNFRGFSSSQIVFKTSTRFYLAISGNYNFRQGFTGMLFRIPNQYQIVIYSSDQDNACYKVQTGQIQDFTYLLSSTSLSLETNASFEPASLDIEEFQPSLIKIEEQLTFSTGDYCKPFHNVSIDSEQPALLHYFQVGIPATFAFKPFTASLTCGTDSTQITYSSYDISDKYSIDAVADFIQVDFENFLFKLSDKSKPGTFAIKIAGTLMNGNQSREIFFFMSDMPAQFEENKLRDQHVQLQTVKDYYLPQYSDPDGYLVQLIIEPVHLKAFISYNEQLNKLKFSPSMPFHKGIHTVNIILQDNRMLNNTYPFTLTVYDYPRLSDRKKIQKIHVNQIVKFDLPVIEEFGSIHVINKYLPEFVTFNYPNYTIFPELCSEIGIFNIDLVVQNQFMSKKFQLTFKVINTPPYFENKIENIEVKIDEAKKLIIPQAKDFENQPMAVEIYELNKHQIPEFLSFNYFQRVLSITPQDSDQIGSYTIVLNLTDSCGAFSLSKFIVKVVQGDLKSENGQLTQEMIDSSKTSSLDSKSGPQVQIKAGSNFNSYRADINIKSTYRDGRVKIKLISEQGSEKLASLLNNQTLEINLIKNSKSTSLNYTVIRSEIQINIVTIKLHLEGVGPVSDSSLGLDLVQVIVKKKLQYKDQFMIVTLNEGKKSQEYPIPPQVTTGIELKTAQLLQEGHLEISYNSVANFFVALILQIIWNNLDDISFLTINTMISINVPGVAQLINEFLQKLIYFDILFTERWFPQLMNQIGVDFESTNDEALNHFFEINGFKSMLSLKNLGSTIIFIFIYILLILIIAVLKILSNKLLWLKNFEQKLKKLLFWNGSLTFLFSQFPIMLVSSLININNLDFQTNLQIFSTLLTLTSLSIQSFAFFQMTNMLWIHRKSLQSMPQEWKILKEDLNTSQKSATVVFWKLLSLFRWLITITILVFLRNHPGIQIQFLISCSLLFQILLISCNPYQSPDKNDITIFNELNVSLHLYLFLGVASLQSALQAESRVHLGWALALHILFVVAVNFLVAVHRVCWKGTRLRRMIMGGLAVQKIMMNGSKKVKKQQEEGGRRRINNRKLGLKKKKKSNQGQEAAVIAQISSDIQVGEDEISQDEENKNSHQVHSQKLVMAKESHKKQFKKKNKIKQSKSKLQQQNYDDYHSRDNYIVFECQPGI